MTLHPDEQAREIIDYFDGSSKANSIEFVGQVLARVRQQALEEACAALCEHCRIAEPRTIESDERGTYYWHDFGNLSMECQASKVRQAAGERTKP